MRRRSVRASPAESLFPLHGDPASEQAKDVHSPPHSAVLAGGAPRRCVGRQREVRGELPGQMQRGALRRDAALRPDGAG